MGRTVCVIKPLCGVAFLTFFPSFSCAKVWSLCFLFQFSVLSFYYLKLFSILVYFEARRKKQRGELHCWNTFSDTNLEGGIYFFSIDSVYYYWIVCRIIVLGDFSFFLRLVRQMDG